MWQMNLLQFTIGQRKDDTGKNMKGRLCFPREPDPESKALL